MAEFGDFLLSQRYGDKSIEVTVEMLEYEFVNNCEDLPTLQAVLQKLKKGDEGYYPHV